MSWSDTTPAPTGRLENKGCLIKAHTITRDRPYERCGIPHPPLSEFGVEPSVNHMISGGDVTNNKPALLVFYGLIIASVTVWVSLAATML